MSIKNFIINMYCLVDEMVKKMVDVKSIWQHGFKQNLSNSGVITMDVVAEFLDMDTDKRA